jgi:hypothetical protein
VKTTIDIAEPVLRQVKARAALRGQSLKGYILEALRDRLRQETQPISPSSGWRSVLGKAPRGSTDEVQQIIDEEFSRIDPRDWQ